MTPMAREEGFWIVGISDAVWKVYVSWFTSRQAPEPSYVTDSVFVAHGTALVAGCCIYPTDGPFAVVEHAATNPDASARLRHGAMLFGARKIAEYGAMRKKNMLCFPRNRGIEMVLRRAGFKLDRNPVMTHGPWSEK